MISRSLIKYLLIGVVNTIFGYGVIFLLLYVGVMAEVSNAIGYLLGFFISYLLNKTYNFKSNKKHKEELPKFIFSMGVAYLLNLAVLIICFRFMGIDVYISQIIAGIIYTLSGYILSKRWVFRDAKV